MMKRVLLLAGLAVAFGATSLTAQYAAKEKPTTKDTITATGCLQAGTAADTFTLSNVTQTSAASKTTGTSGSATATASASAGGKSDTKYELVAGANVNLKPHVGHKVEISGTPDAKAATGTTSTTAAKKITVTSVKHVAASCP